MIVWEGLVSKRGGVCGCVGRFGQVRGEVCDCVGRFGQVRGEVCD